MTETSIMLFTRDLRVHDNPALAAACAADRVVPLFVLDDAILNGPFGAPNRLRFMLDSLGDLRAELRRRDGDLVVRRGDPVAETLALAARTGARRVYLAADVSAYAARRLARLRAAGGPEVSALPGLTVVPPGAVTPAGGDHYRVFTPYLRAWTAVERRGMPDPPAAVRLPAGIRPGRLPGLGSLTGGTPSPELVRGGERAGRERMRDWLDTGLAGYPDGRDDLARAGTSRLGAYLRFGCVSPLELAIAVADRPGGADYLRQLAWRDFHHQVTAAFPGIMRHDYRPRGQRWNTDDDALDAWRRGRTGYPIVDAGMRQLLREGWMHNRARLITASFLTRNLGVDWRHGLRHFTAWLVDGDVADDAGNWQWVAGTGNDTRPNRVLNTLRQAARFDPAGDYVRAHVPELAGVDAEHVHRPWRLPAAARERLDYPPPIVEPAGG